MRSLILILFILLLWLQYRLWEGSGSIADVRRLQGEVAAQKEKLEHLTTRNQVLEAEVLDLKHGSEALEERARSELGMISQGEVFYQTVESAPASAKTPKNTKSVSKSTVSKPKP